MSKRREKPGPSLEEAIKASRADGVLMVEVRSIGSLVANTGTTVGSIMPDTMAYYNYLKGQATTSPATTRSPHRHGHLPAVDGRAGCGPPSATHTTRRPPSQPARLHVKLVNVMAKDRMIAARPS
jgi:hypothetical protein